MARMAAVGIASKQMVPVVISAAIWGKKWMRCGVLVRSDNMAVHCLVSGMARDRLLMHLLHCLQFVTATHQIGIEARHVCGVDNTVADTLSRDNMMRTFFDMPQPQTEATQITAPLLDMLLNQCPDRTSPAWRKM